MFHQNSDVSPKFQNMAKTLSVNTYTTHLSILPFNKINKIKAAF